MFYSDFYNFMLFFTTTTKYICASLMLANAMTI